jgi:aminopeptidase
VVSSQEVVKQHTSADVAAQWSNARVADANKPGQVRVFYPLSSKEAVVAAVSLQGQAKPAPQTAPDTVPAQDVYQRNEHLEQTRVAVAKGVRALREVAASSTETDAAKSANQPRTFAVDTFTSPHAAAVGAGLALWQVNHFRTRGPRAAMNEDYALQGGRNIEVVPLSNGAALNDEGDELKSSKVPLSWETGKVYAEAQNWSRELEETPANLLTPTIFCKVVTDKLKSLNNVSFQAHDEAWARAKGMGSFLSVTQGTDEPAKMLEIHYKGAAPNAPTIGLVGKGITFDSGGISLKPGANMKLMRADMGGAACVVSTVYALAKLQIPVNVVCVTPLTENLPSGHATKPGDVHKAMNGLTIDIDNTDAEGRLVLADALTYVSREYKPSVLLDVATLTGAIVTALGDVYSAAFVEDERLWQGLKAAGEAENDPFWRMPLDDRYLQIIDGGYADLVNRGLPAGACTAAIFLKQFVEGLENRAKGTPATVQYAHLDIAGSMEAVTSTPYQDKGRLTGRPVRALIEFARRFASSGKA